MKPSDQWPRREWLLAVTGAAVSARAATASGIIDESPKDEPGKLSGFYYRRYSQCLPDHLSKLARNAYLKRNHELSLITTPAEVRKRQQWTRETFWKLVGGQPERTPLNPRVVGRFDRDKYAVEKVVYESRPGLIVSANLYLPMSGRPPYPGVLFQMGHSGMGKAYAPYQKCCQGLAQLGFVVLAFDPMGQGERVAYPDASGTQTRLDSVDEEHTMPGKQMLLLGDSAARYQVWDAIRSLDYLASHSSVDPQRLASTGQSGGGTVTMLLSCVDDRLSAAAVCSGNTENLACAHYNPPGATDDAEQDLINSGIAGFDRWDLLYTIAPKPLLIQVSAHDFFGTYSPEYLDDGREEFEKLSRIYRLLDHPDRLSWRSTPLPHGLNYEFRIGIYNWFNQWLNQSSTRIQKEPSVKPEEEKTLWTGPTGNVARDHASLRPFDLIKRSASAVHPAGSADSKTALALGAVSPALKFRELSVTSLDGARVAAVEVQSAGEVWIPAWIFIPDKPDLSRAALLVFDDHGRNAHAHEDDWYHQLARSGRTVCAPDLRGIGDSRPEVGRGNPAYTIPHDSEEEYAWASLILGESLLAQRVTDVLAVTQALRNYSTVDRSQHLSLAARGRLTVPALFAFAASAELDSLYLAGGLVSYQSVLETESYNQPLANIAWNLFQATDLPLLASQTAPRRIHIAGAVNGAGDTAPVEEVQRLYSSQNVSVSPAASWSEQSLSDL
jgi:dienelactone hydrolase